jgi:hypothetical protein
VGRMTDGPDEGPGRLPSLGVLLTVFHRTRFYRDALRSIAEQRGTLPAVQVIVVRSPDVEILVPPRIYTRGWGGAVVLSGAVGEGPFLADGLRALSTEFVLPLDDDDLWEPDRLSTVARALADHPRANYYHNGQAFVRADGQPIPADAALRRLRRFAGAASGAMREVPVDSLRRRPGALARWGTYFNNSSIAIRRTVLEDVIDDLRATPRLIDSFMFYAAASGGGSLMFDPARLTSYRIHDWNRSRGPRVLGPFEAVEASQTREGRLRALRVMEAMVARRRVAWLTRWLGRELAYIDLLEGLREGDTDRGLAIRRTARLMRYVRYTDPVMNVLLSVSGLAAAASPRWAHRAYWSPPPPARVA